MSMHNRALRLDAYEYQSQHVGGLLGDYSDIELSPKPGSQKFNYVSRPYPVEKPSYPVGLDVSLKYWDRPEDKYEVPTQAIR